MLSISLVTNDLTLPAKISALVTLGKVIKPFFNSSNALLLVDADHFPDGTFTFRYQQKWAVSILTPCSVLV
jgi:hypothetical protein